MPDIQKDCASGADSRVDKLRCSNHESRNKNSQGPSAINIHSNTAMLFRRRRGAQEASASSQRRSLISTSAYAVCVYCTFLRRPRCRHRVASSPQHPTTHHTGRAASFSEREPLKEANEGSTLGGYFGIATIPGRTQCGWSAKGLTRMTRLCKLEASSRRDVHGLVSFDSSLHFWCGVVVRVGGQTAGPGPCSPSVLATRMTGPALVKEEESTFDG
jgi:hypothetical protein